ncbi:imidazolonepropionase [Anaeromicrobium sediminis]|uniref:Imidazolonepropionase n=1 Tax=Anaeromicrobium sediminis TaxID=1478221 RepID=A0A267M8W3_9FIRM|nr:imidazolonepropionase [Anaeromicrobium sediminis]PAB55862.1 imidazolonepropionase [Anaeromicrobium sediminis]
MEANKLKADLVISNCTQLLTCKENAIDLIGKIDQGWIAIEGEKIVAVGTKEDVQNIVEYDEDCVIDGSGKIVLPGFVDCHTHLVFGGSRVKEYAARMITDDPNMLKKMGIKTGIMATVDMTRDIEAELLFDDAADRLKYMLLAGTTTVESKSGYGLTTSSEIKMLKINQKLNDVLPIDIVSTFLGAHGWPEDIPKDKYVHMLIWEMIPWVAELGLAKFCDVWCDDGHYTAKESEKILSAAKDAGMEPKIHTDAYSYIGGSDLAAEMEMVSADHLNYTPRSVMGKLKEGNVTGVLLPAIDFAVKHPKPFNPRPMIEEGMTLALATNCCPGCFNTSLQFVMMLACRQHGMSAAEAVRAATIGGAKALGLQKDRGSLEVGKLADIQIWDASTYEDVIYRLGVNLVDKVIKRGEIVVENNSCKLFLQKHTL